MIRDITDLHTHGIGRYDTRTERFEDILSMARLYRKAGTSAILPTIYPAPMDAMRKNMKAVKQAMHEQGMGSPSARTSSLILGVHLEGPFLNPLRCGALNKNSFIKPSVSALRSLIDGYEDIVKVMTIAPEIPGSLNVIGKCRELGMMVNMGHSDATYKEALDGKKAGATGITHLFNAMRPFHHREPGLAGLGLLDTDLYIEIIADGVHLHLKILELIFNRKRLDKILLVSDSVKGAKGAPVYRKGVLAGSGATLSDSVGVLKKIGIPEAEIIEAAVDNPARYIGISR